MSKGAKYWDHPWNPVVGCRKASEGCEHCYAERMTGKFRINGGDFTPKPMAVKNPPKSGIVFAGNMTDLFGEWNTREQIRHWLAQLSRSAVNLVLTKRAERMAEVVYPGAELPHIWWGVTAENQQRAEERIPHLLGIKPLGVKSEVLRINRWLSLEPLLGPINITSYIGYNAYRCECGWHETERNLILSHPKNNGFWGWGMCKTCGKGVYQTSAANWVVVGAESGTDCDRRECKLEWIESIVEQCQAAGVPVFVKQIHVNGKLVTDINKFPEHLRIRETPWGAK